MSEWIFSIATWLVPLVIAIVFHEVAHGLVARQLGDPTAEQLGRLTLNPFRHVDPVGTVILPMVLALAKAPIFGWAKPVPVDYLRLRHPRRDMVLVALAGPGMNFLLAGVAALLLTLMSGSVAVTPTSDFIAQNLVNFILINIFLAVFNLIPLPPFDGGHVVEGLLPRQAVPAWRRIGVFAIPVLLVLLLVLPMISDDLNIVARLVTPVVEWVVSLYVDLFGLA
jgi:Zn-dependent protease